MLRDGGTADGKLIGDLPNGLGPARKALHDCATVAVRKDNPIVVFRLSVSLHER